jgi:phytoene synthase
MAESAASCDELVRRVDFNRYLSTLFVPRQQRAELNVLYAFNYEVARTAESVSQPIAGQIRLQWWRDRIAELYRGVAIDHRLVEALGLAIVAHALPRELFDDLIDAREHDLEEAPFPNLESLESYADATSGHVMRLAARILGARDSLDNDARSLGIAYALTGLCRALPQHAARRRLMLPADRIAASGLSIEAIFSGTAGQGLQPLIEDMATRARFHLDACRGHRIARGVLPALLPASLVRLYLRKLTRPEFEPLRDASEISIPRRQLAMLGAMIRRGI